VLGLATTACCIAAGGQAIAPALVWVRGVPTFRFSRARGRWADGLPPMLLLLPGQRRLPRVVPVTVPAGSWITGVSGSAACNRVEYQDNA
jgi:anti-sigma factor RsiW